MPRKTIIIFISVFVIVGAIMLGIYFSNTSSQKDTATSQNTTGYQSFNPFGSGTKTAPPSSTTPTSSGEQEVAVPTDNGTQTSSATSLFHQLTTVSVAGAAFFQDTRPLPQVETTTPVQPQTPPVTTKGKKTQKTKSVAKPQPPAVQTVPAIRYVERTSGHIYEIYLDDGSVNQISNSTIPSIYEALFDSKAASIIYRYLGDDDATITSYLATLGASQGEFLPNNITDVTLSPDKSKFFYITENANTVTGTVHSFGDTKKTQIFSSPFTEWLSQWVNPTQIFLTTKASYAAEGSLFSLNVTTGTLTKVFGGVMGFTTLANNTGTRVLYSTAQDQGPKLSVLDPIAHKSITTPFYTLPEKCVWSADGATAYCAVPTAITGSQYPDVWYQGQVSFDDKFVKIDTSTGNAITIADSTTETSVDATHLFINSDESKLFFINKKDSTLWSLDLK